MSSVFLECLECLICIHNKKRFKKLRKSCSVTELRFCLTFALTAESEAVNRMPRDASVVLMTYIKLVFCNNEKIPYLVIM